MTKMIIEEIYHIQIFDKELNLLNNNKYIDIIVNGLKIIISRINMGEMCFIGDTNVA